ncbi:MAG: TlpA disulfide reductase family protein, partial [Niameybacter sp.]
RTPKFEVPSGGSVVAPGNEQKEGQGEEESVEQLQQAPDFTLTDQYGNTHTLSAYKGKTVFLNFWATWCPPCKEEMPDIEALYKDYGLNAEDVVVLGVAFPNMGDEKSKEEVIQFLEDEGYTFPVVMDEEGALAYYYGISAFPTTFLINPDGTVEGYLRGMMSREMMDEVISKTRE